jgi:alpha/beta superfamily hydrolase
MTSTIREELVFFSSKGNIMAGVHTFPPRHSETAVLIPWGAGAFPSSARNQLRARLARELASDGYHTFRFDYPGVGEASGEYRTPTMATPYVDEVVAAVEWLASQELSRIVIVANCFGAWSSLIAAPTIPGLEAMALINCPVRRDHHEVKAGSQSFRWWAGRVKNLRWSNLLSARHRARYRKLLRAKVSALLRPSPSGGRFAKAIEQVVRARIPILMLYGPDGFRVDFDIALERGLSPVFEGGSRHAKVLMVDDRLEGFPSLSSQDQVVTTVRLWLSQLAKRDS